MTDQTYTKSKAVSDPKPHPTLNQLIEKVNDVIAQNSETLSRFEKQMDIIYYIESDPIDDEKNVMDSNSILFLLDDKIDTIKSQANYFNSLVNRLQSII